MILTMWIKSTPQMKNGMRKLRNVPIDSPKSKYKIFRNGLKK